MQQHPFQLHINFLTLPYLLIISLLITSFTYADTTPIQMHVNIFNYGNSVESALKIDVRSKEANESAINTYFTKDRERTAEQEKLVEYTGIPGTAPRGDTITATGAAIEEVPSGPDMFIFFTQTLANGFYYEGRLYGKYNMLTQNPVTPSIPPSSEDNPPGYKGVVKLGYNFHINKILEITPYLRLEAGQDYGAVYADTTGNYIHSELFAFLPGFKQTFNLTHDFSPYIDIYGGYQLVNLSGNCNEVNIPSQTFYGSINQLAITTELGFAYIVSEHLAVIPYTQFAYIGNNPNAVAAAPYDKGGFNISQLTGYQPMAAIKLSYAW
jgi:hypothetical protein